MTRQASKRQRRTTKQLAWAKRQGGWNQARPTTGPGGCPTPQKRRFDSREAAEREAPASRMPYRCPCGDWHLKTRKGAA